MVKNKIKDFVNHAVYIIAVFGLFMTLPQLGKIWIYKNAIGVSIISWSTYLFCAMFWLIYGIYNKQNPIIFSYGIWIVFNFFIVVGIFLYG